MLASSVDRAAAQPTWRTALAGRLSRGLAISVLVSSILPVALLGPSLLRAPVELGRELRSEVMRLLARPPAHDGARSTREEPAARMLTVSLGSVYGRWSAFPQAGRDRRAYGGPGR